MTLLFSTSIHNENSDIMKTFALLLLLTLFCTVTFAGKEKIISKESSKTLLMFWQPVGQNSVKVCQAMKEIVAVKGVTAVRLTFDKKSIKVVGILDNGGVLKWPQTIIEVEDAEIASNDCPWSCD